MMQNVHNNQQNISDTMSTLKAGSVVECSCGNRVRLFKDYRGSLSDFKCASCLPHLTFVLRNPKDGNYTNCASCSAQYQFRGDITMKCYVCAEQSYVPQIDPKTPAPKNKPTKCPGCRMIKDVSWGYCPYIREIHEEYVYMWRCDGCYREACMDI